MEEFVWDDDNEEEEEGRADMNFRLGA